MDKFMSFLWRTVGVISVLVMVVFIWLYFFAPRPQTTSTNYISALTLYDDEETPLEDATIVSNINVYRNSDKTENGKQLFEWSMTTYQGTNHNEKHTKGIQILGDFNSYSYAHHKTLKWTNGWPIFNLKTFYLWYETHIDNLYSYDISYDKGDGIAYASPTAMDSNSKFIVSVGSGDDVKLVQLRFKKDEHPIEQYYRTEWFGLYDDYLTNFYCYDYVSLNYTIASLYKTIESLEEGTHYLTLDLAEFFDVYVQNNDNQFVIQTTDTQFTYVTCKITINEEGMTTKNQSMFGMVAQNDGSVTFEADEKEKLFWKANENISLNNDSFELRYSEYYGGNLLHIKNEAILKYKDFKNLRIHLNIDLTQYENVIGIDSFGLDGLNYHDITITGNNQDFYFMSNSLKNIKVGTIYHSADINLVIYDNVNSNIQVVA